MLGIASKVERDRGLLCGRRGPHERAGPDAEMAIVEKDLASDSSCRRLRQMEASHKRQPQVEDRGNDCFAVGFRVFEDACVLFSSRTRC